MNVTLAELAQQIQKQAGIFIPLAYTLGRQKVLKHYGINRTWGAIDQVNIEILLHRHSEELAKSFSKIEERVSQGEQLADLIQGLINRLSQIAASILLKQLPKKFPDPWN